MEVVYRYARWLGIVLLVMAGCKRSSPRLQARAARPASSHAPAAASSAQSLPFGLAPRTAAARREACEFKKGDYPQQTLEADDPLGQHIPIDHFVIVMQENRSFDHYFHDLPRYGQPAAEVAAADTTNEDPKTLQALKLFHQTSLCGKDTRHDWNSAHAQFDDGKMDGFVGTSNPHGSRALGYYDAKDLNYYYALANTFAIGDRYFASVLGPTWPNRMFFHSGTTFGHIGNSAPPASMQEQSLFHQLSQKGIEWVVYSAGMTFEEKIFRHLHEIKGDHFKALDGFFADAKENTLPAYVWIESTYGGPDATDEHPPADIQLGQRFVASIIQALMKSPAWPRSALFIMYDEPGGFFDHVPPPPACPPDEHEPILEPHHVRARFDRLGMRTPFIVVSPFSKPHYVSHQVYSHSSVPRLVQARYGLPALSARDANAAVPYDLFDFQQPPFLTPPALPPAIVDEPARRVCHARFRKKKPPGATVNVPDYGPTEAATEGEEEEGPREPATLETAPSTIPSPVQ